jgi:hypothetical protein
MRALALAILLSGFGLASADLYQVQNRRPSAILANLLRGHGPNVRIYRIAGGSVDLVPAGVTLVADDAASTISIEGSAERNEDMLRLLHEFDVAPAKIVTRITIRSSADKYEAKTSTDVANNSAWKMEDTTTGISIKLSPRINGDGTVTGTFDFSDSESSAKMVTRLQIGKPVAFILSQNGTWEQSGSGARTAKNTPTATPGIEIEITFEMESPPSKKPASH